MIARTWTYGERRAVRIEKVRMKNRVAVIVCTEIPPPGSKSPAEGHVLLLSREGLPAVKAGEERTIEFTRGGPTGGYWTLLKEKVNG